MVAEKKEQKKMKRVMTGSVVSDKMNKTIVVDVSRDYMHPLFNKVVRTSKKYKVHDETEQAKIGDVVEFYEGRPVSKTKYMYLSRVISSSAK
jgi:small subunit ribosomal protein S17